MVPDLHCILKNIIKQKKEEVESIKLQSDSKKRSIRKLKDFIYQRTGIIAEIKPASPSKGRLRTILDPVKIAIEYDRANASAISVLTETEYFKGKKEWIKKIRDKIKIPILRKDFIIDEIQVDETYELGADTLLVIVRILDDDTIKKITKRCKKFGMDILYEVHNKLEIKRILGLKPEIIGVNCRNLKDFTLDKRLFEKLIDFIPDNVLAIAESGINSIEEASKIKKIGYDGLLIGEVLMKSKNPAKFFRMFSEEYS
ncbi:MAG: indole-3-glycerol-phosphate synthase [Candidatus Hydrogenedentota bacterium]